MTTTNYLPVFSEEQIEPIITRYKKQYIRYQNRTYIVKSVCEETHQVRLHKADLVSNWYARIDATDRRWITVDQLRHASTLILKLQLDQVDV